MYYCKFAIFFTISALFFILLIVFIISIRICYMNLKEQLGQNIRKYRKLNHITQEKLAELVDVEINSISAFERGLYMPSPDNIVKIADALNIKISDLFTFMNDFTCEDYKSEIISNLDLLNNDKVKLCAISTFIKTILKIC